MKRFAAALLAALLLLSLAGCSPKPQRREQVFYDLFDTVTSVVGYTADEAQFRARAQSVHDTLAFYHRLYDIYNDYEGVNNLKTVNDNAGKAPVAVDRAVIDLLLEAKELYRRTDGRVNVALGSVLSIWHAYREEGLADPESARLPSMAELTAAAAHTDIDAVIIDEAASTVYLADPEMSLDVGALAKGYATEQAARRLEAQGVTSLLLSVGGNVRAIGGKEDAAPWRIGVQDPDGGGYLWTVGLESASLVTSGSYQRYYTVDGRDYCHIIDPDTLQPAGYCLSVTVLTADSALADGLSTALFTLPWEDGLALVEGLEGVEALWVLPGGMIHASTGFPGNSV